MTKKPYVAYAALGGTISMTPSQNGGITSKVGAKELIAQLPQLAELVDIHAETLYRTASCSLTFEQLFTTLTWAKKQIAAGADAVVVLQGTDTIEQSAFFFDLFWDEPQPLIVTGSMRGPASVGFDGFANLLAATQTAILPQSRHRGVLVVLNDSVHNARFVEKSNTTQLHTFTSPLHSPCAIVSENDVHYLRANTIKPRFPIPDTYSEKVMLFEHSLDDDGATWIDYALAHDAGGLIINAVGSGHVMASLVKPLERAAKKIPVIVCSRTGSGSTTYATYGYAGSEIDLQQHGMLMGGWLSAVKARIFLLACLWNKLDKNEIKTMLNIWGNGE